MSMKKVFPPSAKYECDKCSAKLFDFEIYLKEEELDYQWLCQHCLKEEGCPDLEAWNKGWRRWYG